MSGFNWVEQDGGYRCRVTDTVTLAVTPDRYSRGTLRPARGTMWHAQATKWCEKTRTASRYGRDEYTNTQPSATDAMRLAESIYLEA